MYGTASVVFANCTILNAGQTAAELSGNGFGANRLLIQGSVVKNAGCGGAMLDGGDGSWLTPSGVVLDGNHFSELNRRKRTDKPAVGWTGVGHIVRGNVVASSPHAAFMGTGNDCLFEHNTLRNSAYEVECAPNSASPRMIRAFSDPSRCRRQRCWRHVLRAAVGHKEQCLQEQPDPYCPRQSAAPVEDICAGDIPGASASERWHKALVERC